MFGLEILPEQVSGGGGTDPAEGNANGVRIDNATSAATYGQGATSSHKSMMGVNSKIFTLSMWFRYNKFPTTNAGLIGNTNSATTGMSFYMQTSGKWRARLSAHGNADVIDIEIVTVPSFDTWHHLMLSCDQASTTQRMYLDGVSTINSRDNVNDEIAYTSKDHYSLFSFYNGANAIASTSGLIMDIAQLWISSTQFFNLSQSAERDKFYNAGSPVDLGADGSNPGAQPEIFLNDWPKADWVTNLGSEGLGFPLVTGATDFLPDTPT